MTIFADFYDHFTKLTSMKKQLHGGQLSAINDYIASNDGHFG